MSAYSKGLRHGYEDQARAVRDILARGVPDAEKLELIAQRVAERQEVRPAPGEPYDART